LIQHLSENHLPSNPEEIKVLPAPLIEKDWTILVKLMMDHFYNKDPGHRLNVEKNLQEQQIYHQEYFLN